MDFKLNKAKITLQNKLPFLFLLMAFLTACKKESVRKDTDVSQEVFQITIASGGGFTALYKGYTLHSEGQVVHWQRFGAGEESVLWKAQVNPEQIHTFKKQLEESGLLKKTFQGTGNMTTMVTLELPDNSHTWSWPGTGANDSTPDVFKEWYPLVESYCKNLKK